MPTAAERINAINAQTLTYLPAVLAGIQAAEAAGGTGDQKHAAVLDTVSGISGAVAQVATNPTVAAISVQISIAVAIFNALGKFRKAGK